MSEGILNQSQPSEVAIQLHKSTDVSKCSQLLVFVRYANERRIIEEFWFCKPLNLTTKGTDV